MSISLLASIKTNMKCYISLQKGFSESYLQKYTIRPLYPPNEHNFGITTSKKKNPEKSESSHVPNSN